MLDSFRVHNFKAFGEKLKEDKEYSPIPLRPITLIFGANSAGKSSCLHSLLFANHAILTGELDVHFPRLSGDSVDLGGFKQFVYKNDISKTIDMEFNFTYDAINKLDESIKNMFLKPKGIKELRVILKIKAIKDSLDSSITPKVDSYTVLCNDVVVLNIKLGKDYDTHWDKYFIEYADISNNKIIGYYKNVEYADFSNNKMIDRYKKINLKVKPHSILPIIFDNDVHVFYEMMKSKLSDSAIFSREQSFESTLSVLINYCNDLIETELSKLIYLGPLRSYPPRHLAFEPMKDVNWFAGGGNAWEFARKDVHVRNQINKWLGSDFLKTKYEIAVKMLIDINEADSLISEALSEIKDLEIKNIIVNNSPHSIGKDRLLNYFLDEDASGIEIDIDWDEEKYKNIILNKLTEHCSPTDELILKDRLSGAIVSHRDVGIGISQILPVLVNSYTSKNKIIAIEQPEIHLHPALQSEMADLFIESSKKRNNIFLLETHSEHLILRILKRIRQTANNELPKGKTPLTPQDVAVLYVKSGENGSNVTEIPVNIDGEFDRPWPDGFFADRAKELF